MKNIDILYYKNIIDFYLNGNLKCNYYYCLLYTSPSPRD